jgi:hypothetical protein
VPPRPKPLSGVWRDAIRDSDLGATPKAVAWCLSTYMDRNGSARPSRATLAKGASLSDRAVDKALAQLEHADFLAICKSSGGSGRTNTYQATLPTTANEVRHSEWATANVVPKTANVVRENGERGSHESSTESKRKPSGGHRIKKSEKAESWVRHTGWRYPEADVQEELGRLFGLEGPEKRKFLELARKIRAEQAARGVAA